MSSIQIHTLACGMPLLIEPMSGVRSVGITWLIPAGSAADPAEQEGACAVLSELLFRGAGELDSRAQADALDRVGVSRSCEPSTQHIRLAFALTTDRLLEALPLIVDMVRRPRLSADSIEPARQLALQALESLADDPQQRAMIACKARHADAPFNRSGLGTPGGLRAITRESLVNHWEERSRPAGAGCILALAGAITPAQTQALVPLLDRLLGDWTGEPAAIRRTPSTLRGSFHNEPDDSAQVQIVLMHDAPAERSDDAPLERVVSSVLSGGMACRLFTEVREKRGLCYAVSQGYATDREWGRCVAYVGTTPERAQESLQVLCQELDRVQTPQGAVTPEEFERAVVGIRSSVVMSGESTGARAAAIAMDQYRLGRPRTLEEVENRYASLSLDQVNAYLTRRSSTPRTIVALGKEALRPL